jgi:putative NADH-flavin reductase
MKLLIFGASGPAGLETTRKALSEGHQVNVMVRSPEKLHDDIKGKVNVFHGELTDESTMLSSMDGVNAVISALGPHVGSHTAGLPITNGYRLMMDCMRQKGIRRLLALSTLSVVDEENDRWCLWAILGPYVAMMFYNSYNDIIAYSKLIREQTDIDWTLYRVPHLQNSDHETGTLRVNYVGDAGPCLYRKDIAKFCIDEVVANNWIHKLPALSSSYSLINALKG